MIKNIVLQIILFLAVVTIWWGFKIVLDYFIPQNVLAGFISVIIGIVIMFIIDGELYNLKK